MAKSNSALVAAQLGTRWGKFWRGLFGPKFLPDVAVQSEDPKRHQAEGMMRVGDEGPVADPVMQAVDKLPEQPPLKRRP